MKKTRIAQIVEMVLHRPPAKEITDMHNVVWGAIARHYGYGE